MEGREAFSRPWGAIVSETATDVLCAGILEHIRSAVSPECFQTWFRDLTVQSLDKSTLNLVTPNRYVKLWLDSHYRRELLNAASALDPQIAAVNLTVRMHTPPAADSSATLAQVLNGALPAAKPNSSAQNSGNGASPARLSTPRRIALSPAMRLETFLVGRCNRVAHAAAHSVAETPSAVYNPLFIHGAHGLGKTHLLQGIGHLLKERVPALAVGYFSCEEFTNLYVSAVQNKRLDLFRAEFRSFDALLVDDVQFPGRPGEDSRRIPAHLRQPAPGRQTSGRLRRHRAARHQAARRQTGDTLAERPGGGAGETRSAPAR